MIFRRLRPLLFAILSAYIWISFKSLLWIPFSILAIFFLAVDIFKIDRTLRANLDMTHYASYPAGVLGEYIIDMTKSYGMFIDLLGDRAFIDIRKDQFESDRVTHAEFLFQNRNSLENSLKSFLVTHPVFQSRKLTYIGLHSNILSRGEVFWEPKGYSSLEHLEFTDSDSK